MLSLFFGNYESSVRIIYVSYFTLLNFMTLCPKIQRCLDGLEKLDTSKDDYWIDSEEEVE